MKPSARTAARHPLAGIVLLGLFLGAILPRQTPSAPACSAVTAERVADLITALGTRYHESAERELLAFGDSAVAALAAAIHDRTADVRFGPSRAAAVLGRIGTPAGEEALLAALADTTLDPRVRGACAGGLGLIATPRAAAALLGHARGDGPPVLVREAAAALGGHPSPEAIDRLAPLLAHPDERIRYGAAYGLGEIGSLEAARALLTAVAESPDLLDAAPCREALAAHAEPATARALIPVLDHPTWRVRQAAAEALLLAGEGAAPPLLDALARGSALTRWRAAWLLARVSCAGREDALAWALTDNDWRVRNEAEVSLVSCDSGRVEEALSAALARGDPRVESAAAWIRARLGARQKR